MKGEAELNLFVGPAGLSSPAERFDQESERTAPDEADDG
jgi:hypothetical protein